MRSFSLNCFTKRLTGTPWQRLLAELLEVCQCHRNPTQRANWLSIKTSHSHSLWGFHTEVLRAASRALPLSNKPLHLSSCLPFKDLTLKLTVGLNIEILCVADQCPPKPTNSPAPSTLTPSQSNHTVKQWWGLTLESLVYQLECSK